MEGLSMSDPAYGITRHVAVGYEQAEKLTREALQEQGFGIMTEINVKKTLKEKLGEEFRPYLILGACNPKLAHRALSAEPDIGLMLPCNVVIYEEGPAPVSYTHLRAHETKANLVCRLLLEKKKKKTYKKTPIINRMTNRKKSKHNIKKR